MTVSDLFQSVQFVVNSQGEKSGVVIDMELWDEILTLLEDLEDADEIQQAHELDEESVPWEKVKAELHLGK